MIREIPAKGIRGFLLYSPFAKKHFFRVYDRDNKNIFTDYDISCEEIEIELLSNYNSLYQDIESQDYSLDWSSEARGKNIT